MLLCLSAGMCVWYGSYVRIIKSFMLHIKTNNCFFHFIFSKKTYFPLPCGYLMVGPLSEMKILILGSHRKCKLAFISETVRDRAKQQISDPLGFTAMNYNIWKFWFWGHIIPQGPYLRKRKRQSKMEQIFYPLQFLLPTKLQLFKIFILRSHEPLRSHHQIFVYLLWFLR